MVLNVTRVQLITGPGRLSNCVVSVYLQADNDHIMGFHQCFILKHIGEAWVCTNDMFRLAIHNFG